MSMDTSVHCDKREHDQCTGSVLVFDTEDGPNRYVCGCHCHNREFHERKCPSCAGTGYLHDVLSYGRYSTAPGRLKEQP